MSTVEMLAGPLGFLLCAAIILFAIFNQFL